MSALVIPLLSAAVVIYAALKHVDIYAAFVEGAMEALPVLLKVLPYMAAMLVSIQLLRTSGALEAFISIIAEPLASLGMPPELLPMALLRPFSGSASMALVADIYAHYGTDSMLGLMASTMMGSSETIFYTLALYFGSVGIQKTRFTLPVALLSGLVAVIGSIVVCNWMFG